MMLQVLRMVYLFCYFKRIGKNMVLTLVIQRHFTRIRAQDSHVLVI